MRQDNATYAEMIRRQDKIWHELLKNADRDPFALRDYEMTCRFEKEKRLREDVTGNGYIFQMFLEELTRAGYDGHSPEAVDRALASLGLRREHVGYDPDKKPASKPTFREVLLGLLFGKNPEKEEKQASAEMADNGYVSMALKNGFDMAMARFK